MLLEFETSANPQDVRFLKTAAFGPKVFEAAVEVCSNPTCDCRHINLVLSGGTKDSPVHIECDLEHQKIANTKELSAGGSELAGAEIPEKDWEILKQAYCGKKQYYTERAVLEDLDASFPFEVSTGSMVGYFEILPYSKPVIFFHGNEEWLIDDQYCVQPKCACTDAAIHFIPKDPSAEMIGIRYNYAGGTLKHTSEDPVVPPVAKQLLASFKVAIPNLKEFLSNRHATLRSIYQNSLQRRKSIPSFLAEKAPGRNDPCPCGSGKKYKKCCGA